MILGPDGAPGRNIAPVALPHSPRRAHAEKGSVMVLFRRLLGDVLRERRVQLGLTLREVSAEARVSLGYISEIERGQKEASSELLAALCGALETPLSDVLRDVSDAVALEEAAAALATPIPVVHASADVVASAA